MSAKEPPGAPASRRTQPRGAATRQKLLVAARALFGAEGYEGAAIGDVARAAGVGVGTVYHHFEDKRAILLELLDEAIDETHIELVNESGGPLANAFQAPDFAASVSDSLRLVRKIRLEYPAIYLMAVDVGRRDPEVARRCRKLERRFVETTRADLEIGLRLGRVRKDLDVDSAAMIIYSAFDACMQQIMQASAESDAETLIQELAEMVSRYLLADSRH